MNGINYINYFDHHPAKSPHIGIGVYKSFESALSL